MSKVLTIELRSKRLKNGTTRFRIDYPIYRVADI